MLKATLNVNVSSVVFFILFKSYVGRNIGKCNFNEGKYGVFSSNFSS